MDEIFPEYQAPPFKELPEELFESVLRRTLEYSLEEFIKKHVVEKSIIKEGIDYKQELARLAERMLDDNWYILSNEPAENGLPALVFQKDNVHVLAVGGRAGTRDGLLLLFTSDSRTDLDFYMKGIARLLPAK